jgi:hypothetical protein
MPLPTDFQFSQASLQDFVDCPERFYLRYVRDVAWPAVEAEPIEQHERHLRHGQVFHQMVQQHLLGIPEERLSQMVSDPDLARWWRNYRTYRPADLPGVRRPEVALTATVAGHRLVAKYDLLLVAPGAPPPQRPFTIFDWKTSEVRTKTHTLKSRLQTRVYRYLLVRAGDHLNDGEPIPPEDVTMVYWFAEHPELPARLPYDAAQYREDTTYFTRLIERIAAMPDAAFERTDDVRRCRYCPYRSYCDRGVTAGDVHDAEAPPPEPLEAPEIDFDFEQIAEIAF